MKFITIVQKLTQVIGGVFTSRGLLENIFGEFIADPIEKVAGSVLEKIKDAQANKGMQKQLEELSDDKVESFLQELQQEIAAGVPADKKDKLVLSAEKDSKAFAKELLKKIVEDIGGEREIKEYFGEFSAFRNADSALQGLCVDVFAEVKQYYLERRIGSDGRLIVNTLLCYIDKRFESIDGVSVKEQMQSIHDMLLQLLNQADGFGDTTVRKIAEDEDRLRWRRRKCPSCGYEGEFLSYNKDDMSITCGACGAVYDAISDFDGYEKLKKELDKARTEIVDKIGEQGKKIGGLEGKIDDLVKLLTTKQFLYAGVERIDDKFVEQVRGELSDLSGSLQRGDAASVASQIDEKSRQIAEQIDSFDRSLRLSLEAKSECEGRIKALEREIRALNAQMEQGHSNKKRRASDKRSRTEERLSEDLRRAKEKLAKEKGWLDRLERVTERMQKGGYREEEEEWHVQQPCEFYFEYAVRAGEHSPGMKEKDLARYAPKLYVERDVLGGNGYILFAVFEPWNDYAGEFKKNSKPDLGKENSKPDLGKAAFDRAEIAYMRGAQLAEEVEGGEREPARSSVRLAQGTRGETAGVSYYADNGFREVIANSQSDKNFSGVGKVRFSKGGTNDYAEYWFFINFAFRVRIPYKIVQPQGRKKVFARVWSRIKEEQERELPLGLFPQGEFLHDSMKQLSRSKEKVGRSFSVTEAERGALGKKVRLRGDLAAKANGGHFRLAFAYKADEKYCLLEDVTPENARIERKGAKEEAEPARERERPAMKAIVKKKLCEITRQKFVCPYCHDLIRLREEEDVAKYRSGGVSCQGTRLAKKSVFEEDKETAVTDRLYCDADLTDGGFKGGWNRLLPPAYLSRINYRIAVIGRKQSGKTVFLSRLLGIGGDGAASCLPLRNSCGGMFSARAIHIDAVGAGSNSISGRWERASGSAGKQLYEGLGIDIPSGKFPQTTQQSEQLQRCPLFVDVCGRDTGISSYVSLYDIAGEDVERGENMGFITAPETLGCFLIIDGEFNKTEENFKAAEELYNKLASNEKLASNAKKVPIAVILTKFDEHEEAFSPDAHCLRGDTADMIGADGKYEGSDLERNIDMASAEIYSYLQNHPKILNVDRCVEPFAKVKFFGVSSLGFSDAIKNGTQGTSTRRMRFMTSPKRIELPFVWMMKQFGIIE